MRTFAANQSKYPYNQEDDNRQKQKDRQIDHQKDQQVFKEDLDSVQGVGKPVGDALGDGGGVGPAEIANLLHIQVDGGVVHQIIIGAQLRGQGIQL